MGIIAIGLSHHTCPVEVREKVAFSDGRLPEALQQLKVDHGMEECVILSTCNRVEIYSFAPRDCTESHESVFRFLQSYHNLPDAKRDHFFFLNEQRSLEHLFRVASGLDSMVLGETEILGQIKKAYQFSLENRFSGSILNRAFQNAFSVAKKIRTETSIQRGSVSVGSVAVDLAFKIFDNLNGRKVMVIGAGDTSEKTARSLLSRGAHSIFVTNRSFERASRLAQELEGVAVHFDEWEKHSPEVDIIISSTSAPHYVIDRQRLEPMINRRKGRPLLLVDIAVPRDIDPDCSMIDGVFSYNIDDLQAIADRSMTLRKKEVEKCDAIVRQRAEEVLAQIHRGLTMRTPRSGRPVKDSPTSGIYTSSGKLES